MAKAKGVSQPIRPIGLQQVPLDSRERGDEHRPSVARPVQPIKPFLQIIDRVDIGRFVSASTLQQVTNGERKFVGFGEPNRASFAQTAQCFDADDIHFVMHAQMSWLIARFEGRASRHETQAFIRITLVLLKPIGRRGGRQRRKTRAVEIVAFPTIGHSLIQ